MTITPMMANPNQNEVRTLSILQIDTRAQGSDKEPEITGRAAVYDAFTPLRDLWGDTFHERIQKGALTKTLNDGHDIFALHNHNWNEVLGRTAANLTLTDGEEGLDFELKPNNTTAGRDALENVRSGLISGCSIGFRIVDQDWEERDGVFFRTINEMELLEITLTPIPAYTATRAEVRSLTPNMKTRTQPVSADEEERQAILAGAERIHQLLRSKGGH